MLDLRCKALIACSVIFALSHASAGTAANGSIEEQLRAISPAPTDAAAKTAPSKRLPSCSTISRGPKSGLAETIALADASIQQIISAINSEKLLSLVPLFHPRLKVSEVQIAEATHDLQRTLGSPVNAAVFRVWLLDSVDGTPRDFDCDGGEFKVSSHYGYERSLGVWLQVMGKGELGRLYVSLVPKDEKFYIGAWHLHQWSHLGLDSVAWQEKAAKIVAPSQKPGAFLLQDIALKLLDQKLFVQPQAAVAVRQKRDLIMSQADWDAAAIATAKGPVATAAAKPTSINDIPDILTIKTALAQDGAGINFYARIPAEITARDFQTRCLTLAKRFFDSESWKSVDGVKCHYILPGEPEDKEGRLGGQYFSRQMVDTLAKSNGK